MRSQSNVFGVSFREVSLPQLGEEILSGHHSGSVIVTPNVNHIVRLHHDSNFRTIYRKADLFVNDSRILRLLSSLGLQKINSLIPGSDLTQWLFDNMTSDTRITIIGASDATADIVKLKYNSNHISHYNPPMGFIDNEAEVEKCIVFCEFNRSDIYFFAVGSPRQEILANLLKESGAKGAFLCIGASILFLAGEEKRAPILIQKMNLEWLYRLIQDPKRLAKRYLFDGLRIFPIYLRELMK
jgi:N-acetylglucosaminyldiphosphoundecaprenol N-acetyl-beta-D-mannosaminyltransferase